MSSIMSAIGRAKFDGKLKHILAIDPGPERSAWVSYDVEERRPAKFALTTNEELREALGKTVCSGIVLAVEMVASYGMAVGKDVFETVLWTGRFIEAWHPGEYLKVYRKDVKLHLCGNARAKDANVRQALLDLFPRTGGGATPQIGTKKQPGPLYGVTSHVWSALAVAVTAADTKAT